MNAIEIVELVKRQNPYPPNVFIEPTKEQCREFNKHLKEFGLSPDAYNGSTGRRTWNYCCDRILEMLKNEENSG